MIVVPVIINGTGPFKFLLDTGTSRSAVTAKLEAKLGLPTSAMGSSVGLTGSLAVSRVHANTVSIGDATVRGLDLTTLPKENGLPSELNGILGEDFLENFDVLIDNHHQFVMLAAGGTALGASLKGERLPLTLEGILEGQPITRRLILRGSVPELGMRDLSFQLDSGTNAVVLFGITGYPALFSQTSKLNTTLSSIREVRHGVVRVVQLGHESISDVAAVSLGPHTICLTTTPNNDIESMCSGQGAVAIGGITPSAVPRDSKATSGLRRRTSVMEGTSHT